jgi:hypothetical protein
MMHLIRFIVLTLVLLPLCYTEARGEKYNVAGNVFVNTLMIQTSDGLGTGFTIDVDGRQYLNTAKHMVSQIANFAFEA